MSQSGEKWTTVVKETEAATTTTAIKSNVLSLRPLTKTFFLAPLHRNGPALVIHHHFFFLGGAQACRRRLIIAPSLAANPAVDGNNNGQQTPFPSADTIKLLPTARP